MKMKEMTAKKDKNRKQETMNIERKKGWGRN